jgi:uncharacterized Fe-S cluster protein YjdI
MADNIRKYTNGEVTVVWQPAVCIHSRVCFSNLPEVFDPGKRPWVTIDGASTERIVAQVSRCPSGALSLFRNDAAEATGGAPVIDAARTVETVSNGPLLVYGNLTVKDAAGTETRKSKVTAFCRCGLSHNKPYCDGTHVAGHFIG